ncbi:hypothetical protein ACH40F_07835 [Streptomyces sp. NPDC020794]|uniref:hypothetical protein n=1 Tax=unclassified Streptomyces TaxID=2593676 RepID=UPI0036E62330
MSGLRDELLAVRDHHGKLTPQIVVDVARDPGHPLHSRFEWNDAVAGEAWRRQQAHDLIRKAKVVYREADERGPERSVRAFHAVRTEEGHVFEPVEKVVEDPFTQRLVLADMEREWKSLYQRYKEFGEFLEMVRRDVSGEAA